MSEMEEMSEVEEMSEMEKMSEMPEMSEMPQMSKFLPQMSAFWMNISHCSSNLFILGRHGSVLDPETTDRHRIASGIHWNASRTSKLPFGESKMSRKGPRAKGTQGTLPPISETFPWSPVSQFCGY